MDDDNITDEIRFCPTGDSSSGPQILILGLLSRQQQKIAERFATRASLVFSEKSVSCISGKQDYVIIVAKFSNHTIFHSIKSKIFGKRIKLLIHRGGLTTLSERIDAIINLSQQTDEVDSEV